MNIIIDDLTSIETKELLKEHLLEMNEISPPESKHALDWKNLKQPDITFWSIWEEDQIAGFIALKKLSAEEAEIKSMRSSYNFRGQGVATRLLKHLLEEATKSRYQKISLETGSMEYFIAARKLYKKYGFKECKPFGSYKKDPNSVFMSKELNNKKG